MQEESTAMSLPAYAITNLQTAHWRIDQPQLRRPHVELADPVIVAARLCKRDVAAAAAAAAAGNAQEAARLMERARRLRTLMHQLNEVCQ